MPTADQRTGNSATTPYAAGQFITIYDRLTTVQQGSGYVRTRPSPNCRGGLTTPAFGIMPAFTLRKLSAYMPGIRTQRAPMADDGIFKTFTITENLRLQFRAESFNLSNSVWFGAPNTTITSSTFGTVSPSQANDPRNVQLALRMMW